MFRKIVCAALIAVVFSSCEEIESLFTFTVYDQTSLRIESATPVNLPLEIPTPPVTSNSSQEFKNNNTHADLVKEVKLESLKLTLTSPSGKTFSFLKTIRIYISADQEEEIELAYLENISTNSGVLELVPTTATLDRYVRAESYNLKTRITTDETLTESVDVQVDLKFKVTANAL